MQTSKRVFFRKHEKCIGSAVLLRGHRMRLLGGIINEANLRPNIQANDESGQTAPRQFPIVTNAFTPNYPRYSKLSRRVCNPPLPITLGHQNSASSALPVLRIIPQHLPKQSPRREKKNTQDTGKNETARSPETPQTVTRGGRRAANRCISYSARVDPPPRGHRLQPTGPRDNKTLAGAGASRRVCLADCFLSGGRRAAILSALGGIGSARATLPDL